MEPTGPASSRSGRVRTTDHPGQTVNDQKQKRRTPAEIQRDKEAAATKKADEESAQLAQHKAKVAQAARLEEEHQRVRTSNEQFTNRPDLRPAPAKAPVIMQPAKLIVDEDEDLDISREVVVRSSRGNGRGSGRGGRGGRGAGRGGSQRGGGQAKGKRAMGAVSGINGAGSRRDQGGTGRTDEDDDVEGFEPDGGLPPRTLRRRNRRRVEDSEDESTPGEAPVGHSNEEGDTHDADHASLPVDDNYDPESDGAFGLPEDTVIDSSSSAGGFDDDDDVEMDEVEEAPAVVKDASLLSKSKEKPARGDLRREVAHAQEPIPGPKLSSKRKVPASIAESNDQPGSTKKRPKKAEGGVLTGWKKKLASSITAPTRAITLPSPATRPVDPVAPTKEKAKADDEEKEDDGLGGAFAEDTPAEDVAADRVAKVKVAAVAVKPVAGKRDTSQMAVRLVPEVAPTAAASTAKTSTRNTKKKFTDDDLPFPRDDHDTHSACMKAYDSRFKDTMRDWASASSDPFGANSSTGCDISITSAVSMAWDVVFPGIPALADKDDIKIVVDRICAVLNDHRSAIGKEGYKAVSAVWAQDEDLQTPEGKIAYVEDGLEDMRFIYRDPDAKAGTFQSDLVAQVFAYNEEKTKDSVINWGYSKGGLAMCVSAVQRGLKIWEGGFDGKAQADAEKKLDSKAKVYTFPFSEHEWGAETREWVDLTAKAKANDWVAVRKAAQEATKKITVQENTPKASASVSQNARAKVVLNF